MIDKISEFFNSLKERLSNPLVFSFIISWLFWNWPITIALLYSDTVKDTGYRSIYDLINCHLGFWLSVFFPLVSAFAYTFGFPYLRNEINIFQARMSRKENDKVLEQLKGGKVSMEKYLQITETYEKRTEDVEKVINKLDIGNDKVIQLESALMEIRKENSSIKQQIAEATTFQGQLNNSRFFEGDWKLIYGDSEEMNIKIEGQNIYEIGKFGERLDIRSFMRSFTYDNRYKRLHFLRIYEKTNACRFYDLEQDYNGFFGTENVNRKVRFERPKTELIEDNERRKIKDQLGTAFNEIFSLGVNSRFSFNYNTGTSNHEFEFQLIGILPNGKFQFLITYEKENYTINLEKDFNQWDDFVNRLIFSDLTREQHKILIIKGVK